MWNAFGRLPAHTAQALNGALTIEPLPNTPTGYSPLSTTPLSGPFLYVSRARPALVLCAVQGADIAQPSNQMPSIKDQLRRGGLVA